VNVRFREHAGGLQDKEQPSQSQARHSQLSRQIEVSHESMTLASVYPGSYFLYIPDPTTTTTKDEAEKICCHSFSFLFIKQNG
jgi:hypothetical protein